MSLFYKEQIISINNETVISPERNGKINMTDTTSESFKRTKCLHSLTSAKGYIVMLHFYYKI